MTYVSYGDIISNEVHYRIVTELASLAQLGINTTFPSYSNLLSYSTSTECKTLKGERRMIFIFYIITALNYN